MEIKTNLRTLRHRYNLSLAEIEMVSGLSNQYISRVELGQVKPTKLLETQMEVAIETIIASREDELRSLKSDYQRYIGRLLQPGEGIDHEQ